MSSDNAKPKQTETVADIIKKAVTAYGSRKDNYLNIEDLDKRKRTKIEDRISCSGSVTALDRSRLNVLAMDTGMRRRLRWLATEAGANIPYVMTAVNLVSLVLLFAVEWLPSGQVPYTWTTVVPALAAGLVSTAYHFAAGSSMALKASSLMGNGVTLLLLAAAVRYPKRTCCASVSQSERCPPAGEPPPEGEPRPEGGALLPPSAAAPSEAHE